MEVLREPISDATPMPTARLVIVLRASQPKQRASSCIEGDGVELFFNDPIEIPDAPLRAVRLGCALREEMVGLTELWRKRGYDLDFGAGIALGYATCGEVGFEGRSEEIGRASCRERVSLTV